MKRSVGRRFWFALVPLLLLTAPPASADEVAPVGAALGDAAREPYRYYPEYDPQMLKWERGDFEAYLGIRIQAHAAMWTGDDALLSNGDLLERPGFRMRRSRIYVGGQFIEGLHFAIAAELFDQEKTDGPLLDAYIDYTPFPWIGAAIGVMHFPFAKGELLSSGTLAHLDRPRVSEALAPGRQMGLLLHSQLWDQRITLYAGVFNGLQRSEFLHQGYEGVGISLGNRFEGAAWVGRVEFEPLGPLGAAVADVTHSKDFLLGLGGAFFYNDGSTVQTMGWSAYLQAKWMGLHLLAEYIGDTAEPTARPASTDGTLRAKTDRMGVYGELGYVILPELLGLSVRCEWLDGNTDFDDQQDEVIITATGTVYIVRNLLKAQIEYTHREELHGPSVDNDAVLAGVQLTF
jgi:hypothetical protein